MNFINEQAQLFVVAAVCMAIGIGVLYVALGLYGMLADKALRWMGVHAALVEYMMRNSDKRWWGRMGTWWDRAIRRVHD